MPAHNVCPNCGKPRSESCMRSTGDDRLPGAVAILRGERGLFARNLLIVVFGVLVLLAALATQANFG